MHNIQNTPQSYAHKIEGRDVYILKHLPLVPLEWRHWSGQTGQDFS